MSRRERAVSRATLRHALLPLPAALRNPVQPRAVAVARAILQRQQSAVQREEAALAVFAVCARAGDDRIGTYDDGAVALRLLQLLLDGADPDLLEGGTTALHWAAGPDEGMPGDTISRRACIAILARVGAMDLRDTSTHAFRPVQHSVVRNFVGCVKVFAHVGADLSGTVHWAANAKAHASLRELLRLGVRFPTKKDEWEGCTPLMLSAAGHDGYGMRILLDATEARGGDAAVVHMVNQTQLGGKLPAASFGGGA